jgi:hypothetical protein
MTMQPGYPAVPATSAPPPEPPPYLLPVAVGSPLADLLDRRDVAKAAAAEADALVTALTAEIETAITTALAGPDGAVPPKIDIDSSGRPRLRLSWCVSSRLLGEAFKREQPAAYAVYQRYRVPGKGFWKLRELSGGGFGS